MDLALRVVLGGVTPAGTEPVTIRRALRTALDPIDVPGLREADVMLRIGGSVEPAEGHGGVHNV